MRLARLDATGGASAAPTKAMKCCTGFAECETKKMYTEPRLRKAGNAVRNFALNINNYKNGQAKSGQRKRKNKKGTVRMVKKMMTNVFAVFVIFIVLAIIIPLPTPILDFLLIINIGLSLVILLMTMYIKKRLNFRYSRLYFF